MWDEVSHDRGTPIRMRDGARSVYVLGAVLMAACAIGSWCPSCVSVFID